MSALITHCSWGLLPILITRRGVSTISILMLLRSDALYLTLSFCRFHSKRNGREAACDASNHECSNDMVRNLIMYYIVVLSLSSIATTIPHLQVLVLSKSRYCSVQNGLHHYLSEESQCPAGFCAIKCPNGRMM